LVLYASLDTTQHRRSLMAIGLEGGVTLACNPPGFGDTGGGQE
jgi:hypothetical protein